VVRGRVIPFAAATPMRYKAGHWLVVGRITMRNFIYFIIVCVAGYSIYSHLKSKPPQTPAPTAETAQPAAPVYLDVPSEYQGRYISDLAVNADWLRHRSGYKPEVVAKMVGEIGKEIIEIGPSSIMSHRGQKVEKVDIKVLQVEPGVIVCQYHDSALDKDLDGKIILATDGVLVCSEEPLAGYQEKYRRIK
jgi:hypothetical protein